MSGAKPPSSPTPVERPFFLRIRLQRSETSRRPRAGPRRSSEARRAHHELLRVEPVVGVHAAVDHVHHRHGQRPRAPAPPRYRYSGRPGRFRRGAGHRQRGPEDRVGAEAALVRRAVELDQDPVDERLVAGVGPGQCLGDLAVDVGDRLQDPLAAVALLVAVAQLEGFALARGGARGHAGPSGGAAGKQRLHLDGGIPAGVEDLAPEDALRSESP